MLDPLSKFLFRHHHKVERNVTILLVLSFLVVSIGGIVEIVPLFYIDNTIEKVEGVRPYSPLELAGRDIYVREGCYVCHSQQIRPMRDEVERYGHYSLAAESMYDHPFQWGSKRTGPDLARVGNRYSDEWHVRHLSDPRSVVPESIMPRYGFLATADLKVDDVAGTLKANAAVGVPYTPEMIDNALTDLYAQLAVPTNRSADAEEGLKLRYDKVMIRDFDGNAQRVSEMDALVAYLQMLGTSVDFTSYEPLSHENLR
ncbi:MULTISPECIES: cytochrome-c oxidase, cbb3-type subunit II [unclassified Aureimonas]|uniref:cytochrome-c oxidase, cbb3-type subunit II n=1 Tax=unclassified Aureimonas TaxID=2615206 RepID=UPI0007009620|nr:MULTISPECIES: cytochrome-c oxidase, cbb3-type subunit II [unclassified Aureimonas]KQT55190.1 peptidase S41 [Aureimonas sp. Leaf427]KQT70980.1 peptidase S41 [Aureimonas sp. Leaf460]